MSEKKDLSKFEPVLGEQKATKEKEERPKDKDPDEQEPKAQDPKTKPKVVLVQGKIGRKKQQSDRPKLGRLLDLGGGYQINRKPYSGYSVLYRVAAKEVRLEHIIRMMDSGVDAGHADCEKVIREMLVPRDGLERAIRTDDEFQEYSSRRTRVLREKAAAGDEVSRRVLGNPKRVKDGKWLGDVQEMISTCCGSYVNDNRNVDKFHDAGLVFRQFPLKPKDETIYVMLFPAKHVSSIVEMLNKVFSGSETVPRKYLAKTKA